MGTFFAKLLQEHKWICHITSGEATSDMTYSRVLLQKLCKNCPRPEKPFSNSKTISLYITYKNKLFKNQNWLKTEFWKIDKLTEMKNSSNHRVVIQKNPLQITSDHFCMATLWFDEFLKNEARITKPLFYLMNMLPNLSVFLSLDGRSYEWRLPIDAQC